VSKQVLGMRTVDARAIGRKIRKGVVGRSIMSEEMELRIGTG
jgi:hypothetical protein